MLKCSVSSVRSVSNASCASMLPPSLMVFFILVLKSKRSDAFHKKKENGFWPPVQ